MFSNVVIVICALLYVVSCNASPASSQKWTCVENKAVTALSASGSVTWQRNNCTNSVEPSAMAAPLLVVNSIEVDLQASDIQISAGVSTDASNPLLPVPSIAASNSDRNFIAGINGGYFWRTDITPFWLDDVCRGKTRKEAETPANSEHVNDGIHDGLIKINGEVIGSNCDCWGFSRPAIINDAGSNGWHVDVVSRGEQGNPSMQNGLAAGPNLVSYNSSDWSTFIDIPSDDDNINIHEHAANTAVGVIFDKITGKAIKMLFVTTDGSDECGRLDESCGINAPNLASLMKDHFEVHEAMSMDQGGSTTMWIKQEETDQGGDGVVSYSGGGARNVAN